MANRHYKKWWLQMPIGFLFVSAGILAIDYSLDRRPNDEWPVWVVVSIVLFNLGIGFLGSAFIHKVKSDLIRKERVKSKPSEQEEI
jgi:hypothetical protein